MSRYDPSIDSPDGGFQAQEFNRGLMHTRPADRLPNGYYARLVNGEVRKGYPEARRGTRQLKWMNDNGGALAYTVQGVKWFRPTRTGETVAPGMVLLIGDNKLYRCAPGNTPKLVNSAITTDTQACEIIPAFNVAFILRNLQQTPIIYDPYNSLYRGGGVLELPTPVAGSGRVVLPAAETGCYSNDRIWLKASYDQVIASDSQEFWYNTANVFRVESGSGAQIVKMWPYGGQAIAVLKTDGVYRIVNTDGDLSNLYVEKVYAASGCIAADSVQQIGSTLLYLSPNGVEALEVNGDELIAQPTGSFSVAVQPFFKGLSWPAAAAARAVVADNYYLLSVPSKATWKLVDPLGRRWGGEFPDVPGFEPGSEGVAVLYLSDGVTPAPNPLPALGDVDPGDYADITLMVRNEGGGDLDVSGTQVSGTGYTIQTAPTPSVISPGEYATMVVRYTNNT